MDTLSVQKNSAVPSKSISEWLPELNELLEQDILASTRKKCRKTAAVAPAARTTEKYRPLTIAEMAADIEALTDKSSRKHPQGSKMTASMKKRWNSSIKVDKKISHTSEGQMKNNPVRKVLNFQAPRPLAQVQRNLNTETPKFPKPESRAKKSIHHMKAKEPRISGVYKIPETPVEVKKPVRSRLTLANKENTNGRLPIPPRPLPSRVSLAPKNIPVPKPNVLRKQFMSPKIARKIPRVPDTPLSNDSWKSSCDASFLQKEKEIEIEEVQRAVATIHEVSLENIAEVSPPISTPFKEYRSVHEFFNHSSDMETTLVEDNTIMCFDKTVEKVEKDDSIISSLCDMLNKATVNTQDTEKPRTELDILVEIKRETENNIKGQLKLLDYINKLIKKKASASTLKTIRRVSVSKLLVLSNEDLQTSPVLRPTVIMSTKKSPTYKIPKKTPLLRKKVFYKSMPEMRDQNPGNVENKKALTMYMQMKEQMDFLNTPVVKQRRPTAPDTPALTSKNLQMQLNKLFGS